jgi:hypothetical protein
VNKAMLWSSTDHFESILLRREMALLAAIPVAAGKTYSYLLGRDLDYLVPIVTEFVGKLCNGKDSFLNFSIEAGVKNPKELEKIFIRFVMSRAENFILERFEEVSKKLNDIGIVDGKKYLTKHFFASVVLREIVIVSDLSFLAQTDRREDREGGIRPTTEEIIGPIIEKSLQLNQKEGSNIERATQSLRESLEICQTRINTFYERGSTRKYAKGGSPIEQGVDFKRNFLEYIKDFAQLREDVSILESQFSEIGEKDTSVFSALYEFMDRMWAMQTKTASRAADLLSVNGPADPQLIESLLLYANQNIAWAAYRLHIPSEQIGQFSKAIINTILKFDQVSAWAAYRMLMEGQAEKFFLTIAQSHQHLKTFGENNSIDPNSRFIILSQKPINMLWELSSIAEKSDREITEEQVLQREGLRQTKIRSELFEPDYGARVSSISASVLELTGKESTGIASSISDKLELASARAQLSALASEDDILRSLMEIG